MAEPAPPPPSFSPPASPPASPLASSPAPPGQRRLGAMRGLTRVDTGFFGPLPEVELAAWEG